MNRRRRTRIALVVFVLVAALLSGAWVLVEIQPVSTSESPKHFIRYEKPTRLATILDDLQKRGILKDAFATRLLAWVQRRDGIVGIGTYSVGPGQTGEGILIALRRPIRQILRLPETNWANRTAHLLQGHDVTTADDYMDLVRDPHQFQGEVSFPLPNDTLEGYLYPDRYDLPPLYGARRVVLRQLQTFEKKVWDTIDHPKDLRTTLTLASLVQLEAGTDEDRPLIAGVIVNRLAKKMPLQIDATIEYALQKWRRLTFKDYRGVKSPYNTYLFKGLPPGPICSPDAKDIEAALHPAKHNFLYYVALPNGKSIFAATYKDHLKNIRMMKAARKAQKNG